MIFGLLTVIIGLFVSYKIAIHSFREVYLEKLLIAILGIYFSLVILFGLLIRYFQMSVSPLNFLIIFIILTILLLYLSKNQKRSKIKFKLDKFMFMCLIFIISSIFYMYPALPNLTNPCVGGFDCAYHSMYIEDIYNNYRLEDTRAGRGIAQSMSYYPFGLHLNAALLSHALLIKPEMIIYPFMVLITAGIIAITSGIMIDLLNKKIYVLFTSLFILLSIYPASALIHYGFWAQIFGIYLILLFVWILEDYTSIANTRILFLLILLEFGVMLSYYLFALIPALTFFFVLIDLKKKSYKFRIVHGIFFILAISLVGIGYVLNTSSAYPMSLSGYIKDILAKRISEGGSILPGTIKGIGIIPLFFANMGVLYTFSRKEKHLLFFFMAIILQMFALYMGVKYLKIIGFYWFSKMSYLLLYPIAIYAFIGLESFVRYSGILNTQLNKKYIILVFIVILSLILMDTTLLYTPESFQDILIGDRTALFSGGDFPMITYNRIQLWIDLTQGIKH